MSNAENEEVMERAAVGLLSCLENSARPEHLVKCLGDLGWLACLTDEQCRRIASKSKRFTSDEVREMFPADKDDRRCHKHVK